MAYVRGLLDQTVFQPTGIMVISYYAAHPRQEPRTSQSILLFMLILMIAMSGFRYRFVFLPLQTLLNGSHTLASNINHDPVLPAHVITDFCAGLRIKSAE